MTTVAVSLTVAWFLSAFVLRIAIQLRRTGDSGVRIGHDDRVAALAKALFTGSVLAVGLAPVLVATGAVEVIDGWSSGPAEVTGVAMAGAGIAATFVAQLAMGRSWRIGVDPGERTELVTGGVFAVVRNPIFSTMVVTGAGLVLVRPTVIGAAGVIAMLVALEVQVRAVEEPYLRRVHGAAFDAYAARVGRFVPGLGRAARERTGG